MKTTHSSQSIRCGFSAPLVIAISLLAFQSARATQIFYEPFSYADVPTLGAGTSASVWNTGGSVGNGTPIVSVVAGLSYSGLATTPASYGCYLGATASTHNRGAFFGGTTSSGTLYASFLLNVQSLPSGDRCFAVLSSKTSSTSSMGDSSHSVW